MKFIFWFIDLWNARKVTHNTLNPRYLWLYITTILVVNDLSSLWYEGIINQSWYLTHIVNKKDILHFQSWFLAWIIWYTMKNQKKNLIHKKPNGGIRKLNVVVPWSKSTVQNNDHSNFTYLIWLPLPIQKVWIVFVWGENAFIFCYKVVKK